jgi:peptidoglycan/xylan/chitin deacetylase (PgdA/CDA1 family)
MVGRVLTAALHGLGVLLFFIGAAPLVRWLGRKNPKILLYHDCSEAESDYVADLECTTSPPNFRQHMAYIARHYSAVPLESLLSGTPPPRAVAITFDDGYRSVHESAFPILKEAQLPATVYLISGVVDNRALVWVNELNFLIRRGGAAAVERVGRYFDLPPQASPAEVIRTCRLNYNAAKIGTLLAELRQIAGLAAVEQAHSAQLYLSWGQIGEMAQAGVEFGNHSRTHPNMERLTEEEQRAEIEDAQKELAEHLAQVRAFAHPFGHRGRTTASIAAKVGLNSAAEVGGHNRPVDPLRLGRTHVANESVAGLFARMEVVEPAKAMLRRLFARLRSNAAVAK